MGSPADHWMLYYVWKETRTLRKSNVSHTSLGKNSKATGNWREKTRAETNTQQSNVNATGITVKEEWGERQNDIL